MSPNEMVIDVQSANQTLQELIVQVQTLTDPDRQEVLRAAKKLVSSLEVPEEVAFSQIFQTPISNFAIRSGVDLGIFHKLVEGNGNPVSLTELAETCKAEELMLTRIMRMLTAIDYAAESGERKYVATALSKAMAVPYIEAYAVHASEHAARVANRAPEYFRINGYDCPTDGRNAPFQFGLDTELPFFEWVHKDSARAKRFNTCMAATKISCRQWFEWYPVAERLLEPFEPAKSAESTFLVDMGGGKGNHLEALVKRFPSTKNHLVLQDLPGTIASLEKLSPGIRPMVHDIFSSQPVVGALVYYTHFVLHDFTDERCRTLLKAVAAVMKPGYSRLLINEAVIPEQGCPPFFAAADVTMMLLLAGIQRSKRHWVELVESAGLKVVEVWESPDPGDMEGIIEAEVAS